MLPEKRGIVFGYFLIFVAAEMIENSIPYPRTELVSYLGLAVLVCGAIALSSFLKLLPVRIAQMRKVAAAVTLTTILVMFITVSLDWTPKLSSHSYTSLLMVLCGSTIYLVRTTRPDLLRQEESEKK